MNQQSIKAAVGFIGLGVMGGRLARRIARAGYPLTVYDVVRKNVEYLLVDGVQAAESCAGVAVNADVVFTCVPSAIQLQDVLFGNHGIVAAMRPGSILIDLSTIGPKAAAGFAKRMAEMQLRFVDAAMAQGAVAVESGTLTLLLGGDADAVEAVRPILAEICGTHFHFGAAGAGQAAKIAYNVSGVGASAAAAEGVKLIRALGGDLATFAEMLSTVDANVFFRRPAQDVLSGVFEPGFRSSLALKDLDLAVAAAHDVGVSLVVAQATRDSLAAAVAAGHGEKRTSSIALITP